MAIRLTGRSIPTHLALNDLLERFAQYNRKPGQPDGQLEAVQFLAEFGIASPGWMTIAPSSGAETRTPSSTFFAINHLYAAATGNTVAGFLQTLTATQYSIVLVALDGANMLLRIDTERKELSVELQAMSCERDFALRGWLLGLLADDPAEYYAELQALSRDMDKYLATHPQPQPAV